MTHWDPAKPYANPRWRRLRKQVLAEQPLCALCARSGRETPATVVDHVQPHRGDWNLFWARENLQALCATCHSGIKRIEENKGHSQACDATGLPLDPRHPWNEKR
jgi:5-methylcytosine-specific restriction endonuclease McrA